MILIGFGNCEFEKILSLLLNIIYLINAKINIEIRSYTNRSNIYNACLLSGIISHLNASKSHAEYQSDFKRPKVIGTLVKDYIQGMNRQDTDPIKPNKRARIPIKPEVLKPVQKRNRKKNKPNSLEKITEIEKTYNPNNTTSGYKYIDSEDTLDGCILCLSLREDLFYLYVKRKTYTATDSLSRQLCNFHREFDTEIINHNDGILQNTPHSLIPPYTESHIYNYSETSQVLCESEKYTTNNPGLADGNFKNTAINQLFYKDLPSTGTIHYFPSSDALCVSGLPAFTSTPLPFSGTYLPPFGTITPYTPDYNNNILNSGNCEELVNQNNGELVLDGSKPQLCGSIFPPDFH